MPRITAIVNPKGGTGKTTSAVNLAASAATAGRRVLLVDLDKQGSATQWLNRSPDNDHLARVLLGELTLESIVVPTAVPQLELAPASVTIQHDRVTGEPGSQYLLREAFTSLCERDWIVLDAPGDLGPITIMALTAATDIVIPVPAGGMELGEIPKIKDTIAKVRARLNPDLTIAAVLLTQVRMYGQYSSVLARDVGAQLRADFPDGQLMTSYIRDDLRFREAPAARQPMTLYDSGGRGDQDYRAALAELDARVSAGAR